MCKPPGLNNSSDGGAFSFLPTVFLRCYNAGCYLPPDVGSRNSIWKEVFARPTVSDLRAIAQSSSGAFVTVGSFGVILRKDKIDDEWVTVDAGFSNLWRSVSFRTATEVWIVGDAQNIAVSNDGGRKWRRYIHSSLIGNFSGIHFIDANNGILLTEAVSGVTNSKTRIMRTRDGGATWTSQIEMDSGGWTLLSKNYDQTLVAAGQIDNTTPFLYRSFDQGESWIKIQVTEPSLITSLDFRNTTEGIAVFPLPTLAMKATTDGGATWSAVASALAGTRVIKYLTAQRIVAGTLTGTAPNIPIIYRSDDQGGTFTSLLQLSEFIGGLPTLIHKSDDQVAMIGLRGLLIKSADNGSTFKLESTNYRQQSGEGIKALSNGEIFFHTNQSSPNKPGFKSTSDFNTYAPLNYSTAISSRTVMCPSSNGTKVFLGGVSASSAISLDGGNTFTEITPAILTAGVVPSSNAVTSCLWLDASTIVVGFAGGYSVRSTDSGTTWASPSTPNSTYPAVRRLVSPPGTSSIVIGILGTGTTNHSVTAIKRSTDGGVTWTSTDFNNLNFADVVCPTDSLCYAMGFNIVTNFPDNYLFKSTDAGINWTKQTPIGLEDPLIRSIYFFDANDGWAATDQGMYFTRNGGLSWSQSNSPIFGLGYNSVTAHTDGTVYAFGDRMSIIMTPNKGFQ